MTYIDELIAKIDNVLPQTQCTRCGYPSCEKYAIAVATGEAEINQCPPGGLHGIALLADIMQKPILELNPANGEIKPRQIAYIDEDACIGCTLCIKACPVDAIIGANKMMHTVIADECSGCDLCLPACPVDCIHLLPDPHEWTVERKLRARNRFDANFVRRENERKERDLRLQQQAELLKRVNGVKAESIDKVVIEDKSDFMARIMDKAKQS
jgi:electron transport complex protein RnfB